MGRDCETFCAIVIQNFRAVGLVSCLLLNFTCVKWIFYHLVPHCVHVNLPLVHCSARTIHSDSIKLMIFSGSRSKGRERNIKTFSFVVASIALKLISMMNCNLRNQFPSTNYRSLKSDFSFRVCSTPWSRIECKPLAMMDQHGIAQTKDDRFAEHDWRI